MGPYFDPRGRLTYLIIAPVLATGLLLTYRLGFSFESQIWAMSFGLWASPLLVVPFMARRVGHPHVAGLAETLALIYVQGLIFVLLIYPLTAFSGPLVDDQLAWLDKALGIDWPAFAIRSVQSPVLQVAYMSMAYQPLIIIPMLFWRRLGDRAWMMVTAATVALLITTILYPLMPAEGPYRYFGVPIETHYNDFGPFIRAIQGGERVITAFMLTGLISIPSYHAASAIIFAWAAFPLSAGVRWFFILINAMMAYAAVPIGVHYVADIIAGLVVGAVAIVIAKSFARQYHSPA